MSPVDKVAKVFKTAAQQPMPLSGSILDIKGSIVTITSIWSQRSTERKASVQFLKTQVVDTESNNVMDAGCSELSSELMSTYSPSSCCRSLFREVAASGKNPKKQFLEFWKKDRMWKIFDLTALDLHGDVCTDGEFGAMEWTKGEDKLLYVAEKKLPKPESFFAIKPPNKPSDEAPIKGTEYNYIEDWGEALVGKSSQVLVSCHIEDEEIKVFEDIPDNLSVGQAVWAPDGGIVGVAWETTPRRLGLVYCTNRTSWVFHISPDGQFRKLSENNLAVRCPKFSPDMRSLIWFERRNSGPHHGCLRLVKYDWETAQTSLVLDIVKDDKDCLQNVHKESFFGYYGTNVTKCWLGDSRHIVLHTPQNATVRTFLVDTAVPNSVRDIGGYGDSENFSQTLLDVKGDWVLCARSSLISTPVLLLGRVIPGEKVQWVPLNKAAESSDKMVDVLHLESPLDDPVRKFSAIYFGPKTGKNLPLILWPHGGPHSSYNNSYSILSSFFTSLGYGIVMVNYRGSIGAGENSVNFLLGKIGDTDVKDCFQALTEVLKKHMHHDPSKVVLFGGSHGGFLVLHLAGQYPSSFKAVSARNPVTSIPPLAKLSDIPDWAFVEAGFQYTFREEVTDEIFRKMKESSPIRYVDQVTAPVLLLLGKKDLRVPCSQGLHYYNALKANKAVTKALMYEDNHPLGQTMHEADFAVNTALWFNESLDK